MTLRSSRRPTSAKVSSPPDMTHLSIATMLVLAAAAAIAAGVVSNLAVPLVARMAVAVRALDYPGGRKLQEAATPRLGGIAIADRKSTRLNSSHGYISYAVFCLKKKTK